MDCSGFCLPYLKETWVNMEPTFMRHMDGPNVLANQLQTLDTVRTMEW